MSQLDKASLIANLETKIAAVTSATPLDEIYSLLDALAIATDNVAFFVNDSAALPDLSTSGIPDGQIVYVKSINLHVVSWRQKWLSLDGRVYRDDSNVNTVWGWGVGYSGQLGTQSTTNRSSPVSVVGGFTDWCHVSAGDTHTIGIRSNCTLWAWGNNGSGRLGDNTSTSRSSPVSVRGGFTDWCQVSAGGSHSIAVRTNGTAWAWGLNASGRLGDNSTIDKSSPVSVVGGFTDWWQVAAGRDHSLAIRTNGTAWAWGYNSTGQLGDNSLVGKSSPVSVVGGFTDWCQVSAGGQHTVAVRENGTVWAWGRNIFGGLGDASTIDKSSPVSVVGGFTDWCQVSAGDCHSIAIRANGTAWAWGLGSAGQLGNNSTASQTSPVSVVGGFTNWCQVSAGAEHSLGTKSSGTVWAWGYNSGRLGDGTVSNRSSPVSVVGGFTDWCQVSAGIAHSMAIRST